MLGRHVDVYPATIFVRISQFIVVIKIALVLSVFDPAAADTFTLPKSAVAHSFSVLLVAALTVVLVEQRARFAQVRWMDATVAAMLIAFGVSTLFAADQTVALFGAPRRFLGLTNQMDNAITYLSVRVFFSREGDLRFLAAGLAATTVPVLGYLAVQVAGVDPVSYTESRLISTLGHPDILGGYLGILSATACGSALILWSRLRVFGRTFALAIGVAGFAFILEVATRSGILALVAGLFASLALVVRTRLTPIRRSVVLPIAAAAMVIGALLVTVTPLGIRIAAIGDASSIGRLQIWSSAIRVGLTRPLVGLGPDNFVVAYPSVRSEASVATDGLEVLQNSTHNWFLYVATSAGLIGLASLLAFILVIGRSGWTLALQGNVAALALVPAVAYLGQGLVNVNDLSLDWIPFVAAGVLAAGSPVLVRVRMPLISGSGWILPALMTLVALWAINNEWMRLTAAEFEARALSYTRDKRGLAAVEAARQAISADPRRGEYWDVFGAALSAAGNSSAAASAYSEAADREPWQPAYWRNIGIAKLALGDTPAAVSAFERAITADAYDILSLDILSRLAFNRADYPRAIAYGVRAVEALPTYTPAYEGLAAAELAVGKLDQAEAQLRRGIAMTPEVVRAQTNAARLHVLLAKVFIAKDERSAAANELRIALAIDPKDPDALRLQTEVAP